MKILAALSGGVDSAVAAARMIDAGHEVVGVHLALMDRVDGVRSGACCTPADARDAARIADVLGIDYYVWGFASEFTRSVVEPFRTGYAAGVTPNPCVTCNTEIKFGAVLERARAIGFDALCTGHYARVASLDDGSVTLRRAIDMAKDQSYVLAAVLPSRLRRSVLPLGESKKAEVRAEAARRGLVIASKPDSQDICFVPDGDTARWLRSELRLRPGPIVDVVSGLEVGRHDGAAAFTVGQRRGLRLGVPASDGERRYVVSVDTSTDTVHVGPKRLLAVDAVVVADAVWHREVGVPVDCEVQIRAHGEPIRATMTSLDRGARRHGRAAPGFEVTLGEPTVGIAAGQILAAYSDDLVIAAGTIIASRLRGAGDVPVATGMSAGGDEIEAMPMSTIDQQWLAEELVERDRAEGSAL